MTRERCHPGDRSLKWAGHGMNRPRSWAWRTWLGSCALLFLAVFMVTDADAHIASNGFLTLSVEGSRAEGSIELALRDAELAIGLDDNRDGRITWGELRSHQRDLQSYISANLAV